MPFSGASVCGVNTWPTSPTSLCRRACLPSATAIPAASCPRCCKANNPKNESCAASSCVDEIANTPHSSCGESVSKIACTESSGIATLGVGCEHSFALCLLSIRNRCGNCAVVVSKYLRCKCCSIDWLGDISASDSRRHTHA